MRGAGAAVELAAPEGNSRTADGEPARSMGTAWQNYALPPPIYEYTDTVLADLHRSAAGTEEDVIPLMAGYPADEIIPVERIAELTAEVFRDRGALALNYDLIEGVPALREQIALLLERHGVLEGPDHVIVTSGAYQALTLTPAPSSARARRSRSSRRASPGSSPPLGWPAPRCSASRPTTRAST